MASEIVSPILCVLPELRNYVRTSYDKVDVGVNNTNLTAEIWVAEAQPAVENDVATRSSCIFGSLSKVKLSLHTYMGSTK